MGDGHDELGMRAAARIGQTLRGKWHLERLLGVGGMAAVYAATHRNGMKGAVKLLHAELATKGSARERFLREGYAANAVEHEGAVKVLDDDVDEDGSVFLVMELLEGASVEGLAQREGGRLRLCEVAAVGDQLLAVLAAAHEKQIWHRDIKPENLFLTRQGRLKVLDFGIAKLKQGAASARATSTGALMGTPAFMPSEQALGKWSQVDGRTDLWAVGATLLNLLSGRLVHRGETAAEVLVHAATQPAPAAREIDPSIAEPVGAVLDRALAFDKEERWPDARAMREALARACGPGDLSRLVAVLAGSPSDHQAAVPAAPFDPTRVSDAVAAQTLQVSELPMAELPTTAPLSRSLGRSVPQAPPRSRAPAWIAASAAAAALAVAGWFTVGGAADSAPAAATSSAPVESPEPEVPPEPRAQAEPAATSEPQTPHDTEVAGEQAASSTAAGTGQTRPPQHVLPPRPLVRPSATPAAAASSAPPPSPAPAKDSRWETQW